MHKVFISYHHGDAYSGDADYRDALAHLNVQHGLFIDRSVDTGDIDDSLPDDRIRELIRDGYLRDSTVTIVLVGVGTAGRKHVDWEIYSSMFDGTRNKKSGVLAILLPSTGCAPTDFIAAHLDEKRSIYPDYTGPWLPITDSRACEQRYPYLPSRIVDNLITKAKISVTTWARVAADPAKLALLIEMAHRDRAQCHYDLSRDMRRKNS